MATSELLKQRSLFLIPGLTPTPTLRPPVLVLSSQGPVAQLVSALWICLRGIGLLRVGAWWKHANMQKEREADTSRRQQRGQCVHVHCVHVCCLLVPGLPKYWCDKQSGWGLMRVSLCQTFNDSSSEIWLLTRSFLKYITFIKPKHTKSVTQVTETQSFQSVKWLKLSEYWLKFQWLLFSEQKWRHNVNLVTVQANCTQTQMFLYSFCYCLLTLPQFQEKWLQLLCCMAGI